MFTLASGATGATIGMVVVYVLIFAGFYFMLIRPENKRKKEAEQNAAGSALEKIYNEAR